MFKGEKAFHINYFIFYFQANATLRYLLRTQIQIEEDINIKNNSIKIDEVDCMTLRRSIDYRSY